MKLVGPAQLLERSEFLGALSSWVLWSLDCLLGVAGDPVQRLGKSRALGCNGWNDRPRVFATKRVHIEASDQLLGLDGAADILFVGQHNQQAVGQLLVANDTHQLVFRLVQPRPIRRVHHVDQGVGAGEVVAPQGSDSLLSTAIPHGKRHVLVFDGFHVEADRGHRFRCFPKLELVQNGGFACVVEAQHQDSHLSVLEKT